MVTIKKAEKASTATLIAAVRPVGVAPRRGSKADIKTGSRKDPASLLINKIPISGYFSRIE
ncbi:MULTISPECIES: hypothetical protein [Pseudomonas]|uniref:hypothetical protein n=1 Tax=Pseudomonas TaxID=286 RepID=UPI001FEE3DE3|nr:MULTISPECIES: hypothetical protein [Pseudomonas]MDN5674938.1 hypothetical protein [Pseudomonas sp.]MDQ2486703.1 hypothetical protein [Pseudomonas putida]WQE57035.1 hypothetical protein U0028_11720 [Pseudomonas putida]